MDNQLSAPNMRQRISRHLPLILIFCGAFIPMASAFTFFFWAPAQGAIDIRSSGHLISPPLKVEEKSILTFHAAPEAILNTTSGWRLTQVIISGTCEANPESSLYSSHQKIITALGRQAHRVSQATLCFDQSANSLPVKTKANQSYSGILDPNNHLILIYPVDQENKGIYTDLKRLLKYSKLG